MNTQPNKADFALALYETANHTHQRKDWRQACHALADALKAELMRTAAIPPAAADPTPTRAPAKRQPASKALAFEMTAESLSRALRLVGRAVSTSTWKHAAPILKQVLLQARGDVLVLSCSDLDREMRVHVTAPGVGEWAAMAEHKALSRLLGKAKGPVALYGFDTDRRRDPKDDASPFLTRLTISGAVSATLEGLPPADFPVMSADMLKGVRELVISPATLADRLAYVQPAISTEETRYYLNGARLHGKADGSLAVVATDGSRMHVTGAELDAVALGYLAENGVILPAFAVADMLAIIDGQAEAWVGFSAKLVHLTRGPVVYLSKLIDGNFPDYTRVIPQQEESSRWVTFDSRALCDALVKVSAVADSKTPRVTFNFEAGQLTISCKGLNGGHSSETVECDWAGEPMLTGANPRFMRDALESLKAERVKIMIDGPVNPMRLESADVGADGRLAIVMPLRL